MLIFGQGPQNRWKIAQELTQRDGTCPYRRPHAKLPLGCPLVMASHRPPSSPDSTRTDITMSSQNLLGFAVIGATAARSRCCFYNSYSLSLFTIITQACIACCEHGILSSGNHQHVRNAHTAIVSAEGKVEPLAISSSVMRRVRLSP